jgi:hypothetical protein
MDARDRTLAKYGLTKVSYQVKLDNQEGKCYICRREPKKNKKGVFVNLNVDHNHSTGSTRGLLCFLCNRRLILTMERYFIANYREVLRNTANYIDEFDFNKRVKDAKPKRKKVLKSSRRPRAR